jgi:hypothetical protein
MRSIARSFEPESIWPKWTKREERAIANEWWCVWRIGPSCRRGFNTSKVINMLKMIKVMNLIGAGGGESLAATRARLAADYGLGASGQRPYQSNGCGLRFTTTFLVWV